MTVKSDKWGILGTTINISPDVRILSVLAYTPLKPIDALCELIDNALDSFKAAGIQGIPIKTRWIRITIPKISQLENGEGVIRVVDNGIGLNEDGLRGALQAGFSSKNKYDSLGLFGVGFNIATAKLGRKTVVTTANVDASGNLSQSALRATVELQNMKNFDIPLEKLPNPQRGTVVEVSEWWPLGTPNNRFVFDLAKTSKVKLIEQLGRRYATVLRDKEFNVNITVNEESVLPFEHCVWSETRSVNRKGAGVIPAKISFDQVLRVARRCENDGTIILDGGLVCSSCGGNKTKQIEERVRGWVGVQRFDDVSNFGIDIIRNGRAIRVAEKDAFFVYADELNKTEKEYPLDRGTGRIVGEIHLDHVPVDYTKQDFERPSREWVEAMEFIRGGALQAKNRLDGERNTSPVGKIFDGYRYTKSFGKTDMYMGTWSESGAVRISRSVEAEYYQRFLNHESGYWDDAKWWELVENANKAPIAPLVRCSCGAENLQEADVCVGCGEILKGQSCIACGTTIRRNAQTCPICGESQVLIANVAWKCRTCEHSNSSDEVTCANCSADKDAPNPLSREGLSVTAMKIDELSFESMIFRLVDGTPMDPISVTTYYVEKDRLKPFHNQPSIPTYVPSGISLDRIEIYIDRLHPFFSELGFTPEFAVSAQVATWLQTVHGSTTNGKSVLNHTSQILQGAFGEKVSITKQAVSRFCEDLFDEIVDRLVEFEWLRELASEITSDEREELFKRLQELGLISKLDNLQKSGGFLRYVPRAIPRIYRDEPEKWEGSIFVDEFLDLASFAPATAAKSKQLSRNQILRALEDCAEFLDSPTSDESVLRRVKASVSYLSSRIL